MKLIDENDLTREIIIWLKTKKYFLKMEKLDDFWH